MDDRAINNLISRIAWTSIAFGLSLGIAIGIIIEQNIDRCEAQTARYVNLSGNESE